MLEVEKVKIQDVCCPVCGNGFCLRDSALIPDKVMRTHCPLCQTQLQVKKPVRAIELEVVS